MPAVVADADRRLWRLAGGLAIAYVVLSFAGVSLQSSLLLGDKPSVVEGALVSSSMPRIFTGGYIEFLGVLVLLVGGLLLAQLLRSESETGRWLSSCIAAAVVVQVAVDLAVGFAAGAAALYDGHHGAPLATITTVNDIRNFAFFLTGGVVGVMVLGIAAAGRLVGTLPRWLSYSGYVVGFANIAAIPGARIQLMNVTTMLWFVWFVALGVVALRGPRPVPVVNSDTVAATA